MNRALGALGVTAVGVLWLVTFRVTPLPVDALSAPTASVRPRDTAVPTTAGRGAAPTASAAPAAAAGGNTFTGTMINTIYGPVQVRIVVTDQKVTDVQAMTLPRDRARSAAISQYSAPVLRSEAIRAQTANIDIVSGATYTSIAYARSLDAALKQAHLG